MQEFFNNLDWKFWLADVGIPVVTFVIGLFSGKIIEKKNVAKSRNKGDGNIIIQNSKIGK